MLAYICAQLERVGEATALVREVASRDLSNWHVDEEWLVGACLLAWSCALVEETECAGRLYDVLRPFGSLNAVAVPALALGSVGRSLGLLAALLGRFEDAAGHFEDARRINQRMGARPSLARAREDHARMLLRRGKHGDRERAATLLAEVEASYGELGLQRAARRVAAFSRSWPRGGAP